MIKSYLTIVIVSALLTEGLGDVAHILEPSTKPPPAKPYVFSYSAGRSPGTVDRTHTEVSDGTGVIRGAFSYIDPRNQLRTVKYVADENGFHPQLSNPIKDTEANIRATENHKRLYDKIAKSHAAAGPAQQEILADIEHDREFLKETKPVVKARKKHLHLFNKITEEHAKITEEHAKIKAERVANGWIEEPQSYCCSTISIAESAAPVPGDTEATAKLKAKYINTYEKITAEHARIAAEREAERLAIEATAEANLNHQ